jgi:GT2 family glycosyltransferase
MKIDAAPFISALPAGVKRPLISVMIPTCNNLEYLERTLESVLREDLGPEQMQIEVVDNCSTTADVESIVRSMGKGRVTFHRQAENIGMARNFNSCISRARGEWVHILHSDDYVCAGFYREAASIVGQQNPDCIAFRCFIVDSNDEIVTVTENLASGGLPRAKAAFLTGNPVQCPGILVRRSVYEKIGGFRPDFAYMVDVDMWSRVFIQGKTWFSPKCMACFRTHPGSMGAQLVAQGRCVEEHYRMIPYLQSYYRLTHKEVGIFRRHCHLQAHFHCLGAVRQRCARVWFHSQWHYLRQIRTLGEGLRYLGRLAKNAKLWLRHREEKT